MLGLPYGRYLRFLMAWVTTEAVRTKSRCGFAEFDRPISLRKATESCGGLPK